MAFTENVSPLEYMQIVPGFAPEALTTARVATPVSLKNYRRCVVVFNKGIGTAGDDPTITLLQGTDMAFGTSKALNFSEIFVKQDPSTLNHVGQRTRVTKPVDNNTYTDLTSAEQQAVWEIAIKADDLDVENGYTCIRAQLGDVGTNPQIGSIFYILLDPLFAGRPEDLPSALVD